MTYAVFSASAMLESNTFNTILVPLERFTSGHYYRDTEIQRFRNTNTEWSGFLDAAQRYGWRHTTALSAHTASAGRLARSAFEHFWSVIESSLVKNGPFDGILLALHGGMVAEGIDDPEGEIVTRVRRIVGPSVPIAITLDLHGNATRAMVENVNIITAYRTTPHLDLAVTGHRAAELLQRTMAGEIHPTVFMAKPATLFGLDHGRTANGDEPMARLQAKARDIEAADRQVLEIAILAGFSWADIEEAGPCVIVTADGRDERFGKLATDLCSDIWETRDVMSIALMPLTQVATLLRNLPAGTGPLILADPTDNPACGAYGDSTALLQALLDSGVQRAAFAALWDAEAVKLARAAGLGNMVTLDLGARCDPRYGGKPLRVTAKVAAISDDGVFVRKGRYKTGVAGSFGPSVRLDCGGVSIIVSSAPYQIDDREQFRIFGIEPEGLEVIGCKSMNHIRADFDSVARRIVYVEGGGVAGFDLLSYDFAKVRRPIWPLDDVRDLRVDLCRTA